MNDDDRLLASAALDGAVTDEERTRVDADPSVAAEVERLAGVRAALRATPRPDPARRDAAIAAALDAYSVPVAPAVPLTAARRRRWLLPASAAAAVVALGVGAIVAGQRDGGGNDDSAAELAPATAAVAERATASGPADDSADMATSATPVVPPAAAGAAESTEAESAAETTAAGEATSGLDQLSADTVVVLSSPEDLRTFVATAPTRTVPDADGPRCDAGEWIGDARYVVAGNERQVEVYVVSDEVVAVDATTCEMVARARK